MSNNDYDYHGVRFESMNDFNEKIIQGNEGKMFVKL